MAKSKIGGIGAFLSGSVIAIGLTVETTADDPRDDCALEIPESAWSDVLDSCPYFTNRPFRPGDGPRQVLPCVEPAEGCEVIPVDECRDDGYIVADYCWPRADRCKSVRGEAGQCVYFRDIQGSLADAEEPVPDCDSGDQDTPGCDSAAELSANLGKSYRRPGELDLSVDFDRHRSPNDADKDSCWETRLNCITAKSEMKGTQLRMQFHNECSGRVYLKYCAQQEEDQQFPEHCGATGLRAGDKTWPEVTSYHNATGKFRWQWIGVEKSESDWVCAHKVPDWGEWPEGYAY